jgi:Family of unknown function (DUF6328)
VRAAIGRGNSVEDSIPNEEDWRAGESSTDRQNRNLAELLQELRVAGLGVQVLFGFLLALPFAVRFVRLDQAERALYLASLITAALATALLVAPVALHRLLFRQHEKAKILDAANRMAIFGLAAVGLAVSLAVGMVLSFVASLTVALPLATVVFLTFVTLWFAYPVHVRESRQRFTVSARRGGSEEHQ